MLRAVQIHMYKHKCLQGCLTTCITTAEGQARQNLTMQGVDGQGPEEMGTLSKLLVNKEATEVGLELDDKANIGLPE